MTGFGTRFIYLSRHSLITGLEMLNIEQKCIASKKLE